MEHFLLRHLDGQTPLSRASFMCGPPFWRKYSGGLCPPPSWMLTDPALQVPDCGPLINNCDGSTYMNKDDVLAEP